MSREKCSIMVYHPVYVVLAEFLASWVRRNIDSADRKVEHSAQLAPRLFMKNKRFRWTTKMRGNFWIGVDLVHFCRFWQLEHAGFSSPSSTSSMVKRFRQERISVCSVLDGIGRLISQKGSNVSEAWTHVAHTSVNFNCPTNRSMNFELFSRRKRSQNSSAFWLALRLSSVILTMGLGRFRSRF